MGHEGHESDEGRQRRHDRISGVWFRRRDHWTQVERCEGRRGGHCHGAADQLKKNGSFKLAGALNLKLKKKTARPARKGINPFTKEPCVFKAKPASKTVRALPMKKLKEMIN